MGQTVKLTGWVHRCRDHGGVLFIDLRDRYGRAQVVFSSDRDPALHEQALGLRSECVVQVEGEVRSRPEAMVNRDLPTGDVEVEARQLLILNRSNLPPFEVSSDAGVHLETRYRYRYLDLRRTDSLHPLVVRHRVTHAMRSYLDREGFLDVETPLLTKSTPEGARDYIVPSRLAPGAFYALPQSPQLFKQVLMVAGIDRYFQIARCFRDEDLRADRQPEFTQLDLEMSFVEPEDIYRVIEGMIAHVWREVLGREVSLPFPRIPHAEALLRYGSDRPDLRFGLPIEDATSWAAGLDFRIFQQVAEEGGAVRALRVPGGASLSRKEIDALAEGAVKREAKGLTWMKVTGEGLSGPLARFTEDAAVRDRFRAEAGDLLLFVADRTRVAAMAMGEVRLLLGQKLGLISPDAHHFSWIVDFPLFEAEQEDGCYKSEHHPFTMPQNPPFEQLDRPAEAKAKAYDLVLNGVELGGGSIRIHDPELQSRIFRLLGIDEERARAKFGFLLDALRFGAPPHGGIALGLDRMVAIMSGRDSIREVIAFPKSHSGVCYLTDAPAPVDGAQLEELRIRTIPADE